ncbi:MAG: aminotransferase class I/II-fold pyridoxal phosphate-dependent enzyme [Candidatus Eisenbacteria bacterium]|nr:aminotransferase class I/II-fold pyridoxal phosphate-dependent enzyme [Candidatus Eisenbacteria bacterium]
MSAAPARTAATPAPLHPLLTGGGEYPFVKLERRRRELQPANLTTINFGMGDPREETPSFIREAMIAHVPAVSSYPATTGRPDLRAACARWLARRYGVSADPEVHVLPANGLKEAVFNLAFAFVDPAAAKRTVVIPTPAYPVYEAGARFAGAEVHFTPLRSQDGWRFNPANVPAEVWRRTALLWLNSPHNPTGSVLTREEGAAIVTLARRHGFWVASDEAYGDLYFEAGPPPTLLEHGFENVLALYTLSKRSAMTGYRSGFLAGDPRAMDALRRFRPNVGAATPDFIQDAAIAAWNDDAHTGEQRAKYAAKRELFVSEFARRGWRTEASEATFYLWMRVPGGDDEAFCESLLARGIVVTPGSYLGAGGEGFVRWALVPTLARCHEAIERMRALP